MLRRRAARDPGARGYAWLPPTLVGELRGALDAGALREAFDAVVGAHEALRSRLVEVPGADRSLVVVVEGDRPRRSAAILARNSARDFSRAEARRSAADGCAASRAAAAASAFAAADAASALSLARSRTRAAASAGPFAGRCGGVFSLRAGDASSLASSAACVASGDSKGMATRCTGGGGRGRPPSCSRRRPMRDPLAPVEVHECDGGRDRERRRARAAHRRTQPAHLVDRGRFGCTAGKGGVLDGVGRPMSGARGGDELDEDKVDAAGG